MPSPFLSPDLCADDGEGAGDIERIFGSEEGDFHDLVGELADRAKTTREQWLASRQGAIVGTTDQVAERFRAIASAGIGHANVMLPYGHEIMGVRALAQIAKER